MFKTIALFVALCAPLSAYSATDDEMHGVREQIQQLKESYEQRITQMELRLQQAETSSKNAENTAAQAEAIAQQASHPSSNSENSFNPAISLILSGTYGQLQRDPSIPTTGFAMSPNNNGYTKGFSLKESELGISANIDPQFRGVATMSLNPAGGVTVENGFIQTSALGNGLNLKFGRYFSGLGYLNEQHSHAWDFADQPLVYLTFWDNQVGEDGMQLKWLAPTDTFVEFGGELGSGRSFPGSGQQKNGAGSGVLFAHFGDDVGIENSWRAGVSLHETKRENALSTGVPDLLYTAGGVSTSFSGDSRTTGIDFVWKYSPNGNIRERYLKVQGEYFRRTESGLLTYDTAGTNVPSSYANTQSGWYLQSVYQFMPTWRTGLRFDRLDPGVASIGAVNAGNVIINYDFNPSRLTWMVDYNPSEFTRLRLQLAQDNSRQGLSDNQIFLQYIVSMGAHGAHQY
jgi:hypothetical protein